MKLQLLRLRHCLHHAEKLVCHRSLHFFLLIGPRENPLSEKNGPQSGPCARDRGHRRRPASEQSGKEEEGEEKKRGQLAKLEDGLEDGRSFQWNTRPGILVHFALN